MSSFGCILWWCLFGGLLGWLASWLFGRRKPVVVEKIVDRPVDRIVEKVVDRPVDKIVEKIVEKPVDRVIEKFVDNPAHLSRITSLESEVGLLAGLRQTIARLEATPPKIVDRPVDRIVEKIVDRPVDRIVEKIVDRPVEKIVEKIIDRPVDRIVEKIVDRPVDRIVEKVVEKPVDRIVEKVVEKQIDNPEHLRRIMALEAELEGFRARNVVLDKAAAMAAGFTVRGMDDLEVIEGIGPKIAGLFHDAGIHMFWELAETPLARMQVILDAAGPNYKLANPSTWAKQSSLAAKNRWAELRTLQDELNAGVKK
jgi:predicted flap endonuclease-1-like 5' DNA nuclease